MQAFYGVYDGHGGRAAVDFVADKLGKNVVAAAASSSRHEEEEDKDEVMAAIRSAYLTTDSEFLSQVIRTRTSYWQQLLLPVLDQVFACLNY